MNIYVDGSLVPTSTIKFTKYYDTYVLASGLENTKHTITIRRRSEVDNGSYSEIGIMQVNVTDGYMLEPPKASERKMEFIGDSISTGFGNMVTDGTGVYTTATSEGTMTYASMTGQAFGADTSVVAKGGIAVSRNASGLSLIDNYLQTANFTQNAQAWDFGSGSDVVVINLGTNDCSATDANGALLTSSYIASEAKTFLTMVREKNPHALIVWAYGIMGNGAESAIRSAISSMNDSNIFYLPLDTLNGVTEGRGSYYHPTITTNINRSFDVVEFIAQKTGWSYDYDIQLANQLWVLKEYDDTKLRQYTQESAERFVRLRKEAQALPAGSPASVVKTMVQDLQNAKNALALAYNGDNFDPDKMKPDYKAKVDINGVQISAVTKGFRTVYSVTDPDSEVAEAGMIYGKSEYLSDTDLVVGSKNASVYDYAATEIGKFDVSLEGYESAQHYAMTMKFNTSDSTFFREKIWIRAYVKLKDGSYIYSEKKSITIYDVADVLYQKRQMNNFLGHNYLYTNILSIVNASYQTVDYDFNDILVK